MLFFLFKGGCEVQHALAAVGTSFQKELRISLKIT